MNSRYRDAILATFVLLSLSVGVAAAGVSLSALRSPSAAVVGCVGALSLELVMAAFPERSARLWRRPVVRVASILAVFVAAAAGVVLDVGEWVVTALVAGLATYFVLLALVLSEAIPPPETWFR
ncbi:hypothetical protein [Haloprofundus salilacus]|uniref:hypothetical protein n=1 Tax=Haloprofundus salilacus TaxID=2876190 RepID=UPI001CCD7F9D|nr:hypothetical protein [Haloprofundus salilacus]